MILYSYENSFVLQPHQHTSLGIFERRAGPTTCAKCNRCNLNGGFSLRLQHGVDRFKAPHHSCQLLARFF